MEHMQMRNIMAEFITCDLCLADAKLSECEMRTDADNVYYFCPDCQKEINK